MYINMNRLSQTNPRVWQLGLGGKSQDLGKIKLCMTPSHDMSYMQGSNRNVWGEPQ